MAPKREKAKPSELSTLLSDIIQNSETLIQQQGRLLKAEVQQEAGKASMAAASMGAGAGLVALGGMLSVLMLVHWLHKSTRLPLWTCYGLVGQLAGIAGAGLLVSGWKEARQLQLPPPQTVEALKENLEWLKQQLTSSRT
jgi:hypothetical protein